eukprot:3564939-Pyramimonas_sp.AAC.1
MPSPATTPRSESQPVDGAAKPAQPSGSSNQESTEEREQRIAAEAKRLSDANLAAQAHAAKVPGDGGGAGADGGGQ